MKHRIECPSCGSESYEVHSGPEGEPDYAIICRDCGAETRTDDAMRAVLAKRRGEDDPS